MLQQIQVVFPEVCVGGKALLVYDLHSFYSFYHLNTVISVARSSGATESLPPGNDVQLAHSRRPQAGCCNLNLGGSFWEVKTTAAH